MLHRVPGRRERRRGRRSPSGDGAGGAHPLAELVEDTTDQVPHRHGGFTAALCEIGILVGPGQIGGRLAVAHQLSFTAGPASMAHLQRAEAPVAAGKSGNGLGGSGVQPGGAPRPLLDIYSWRSSEDINWDGDNAVDSGTSARTPAARRGFAWCDVLAVLSGTVLTWPVELGPDLQVGQRRVAVDVRSAATRVWSRCATQSGRPSRAQSGLPRTRERPGRMSHAAARVAEGVSPSVRVTIPPALYFQDGFRCRTEARAGPNIRASLRDRGIGHTCGGCESEIDEGRRSACYRLRRR